jgi:hypothetical protein
MAGINRAGWTSEERAEYDGLLAEVVASTTDTTARLDLMERLMTDAVQAQRYWAGEVEGASRRHGYASEIKRYQDRNRAMVASETGEILNVPAIQGAKLRTVDGEVWHQRELIELWSWELIINKRAEAIRSRRVYTDKIAHYDKLLALREKCPESVSPEDAAHRLGIVLSDYLGVVEDEAA